MRPRPLRQFDFTSARTIVFAATVAMACASFAATASAAAASPSILSSGSAFFNRSAKTPYVNVRLHINNASNAKIFLVKAYNVPLSQPINSTDFKFAGQAGPLTLKHTSGNAWLGHALNTKLRRILDAERTVMTVRACNASGCTERSLIFNVNFNG